jgi:hypothetical protein
MDWLTFISNIWNAAGRFAWPAVILTGLVLFRETLKKLISLKFRYKDFEVELVAPQETTDQEINAIVSYLQRSPHSFQWFRDNTDFQYTNEQFDAVVAKHAGILEKVTIVSRDEDKKKSTPGLPGMRLTRKYRQMVEKTIQNP